MGVNELTSTGHIGERIVYCMSNLYVLGLVRAAGSIISLSSVVSVYTVDGVVLPCGRLR